jgi:hypothetical protein
MGKSLLNVSLQGMNSMKLPLPERFQLTTSQLGCYSITQSGSRV